ncbi:MAG: hydrogenase 3 maturation endopeptidase HyCI [Candidatus Atribacteria bacterium]|nr:hydrogenase 3 maturation endopeptidase HyCI [Candidatus Atribacteria bacterium]
MVDESKNILLGVGNDLRSDDGAGSYIANHFYRDEWISLDGRSAPENFTSVIKRIRPRLLMIVDAAQMDVDAGQFRIIPKDKIGSIQFSTHSMSLEFLITYLSPYCHSILLVGIQPLTTKMSHSLSTSVLEGCKELIQLLKKNDFDKIPLLNS